MAYGFLRKVFEMFEQYRTPIDMITTSEVAVSLTVDNDSAHRRASFEPSSPRWARSKSNATTRSFASWAASNIPIPDSPHGCSTG
ncbi:MAG: hypothetical protein ACLTZY_11375 [Alistipes indistinctus]